MTLNELNQFFDTYDKVESRIKEVAPLCTNICSCGINGHCVTDINRFPAHLRIRQVPWAKEGETK